ncbi:MAG: hypothetical protein LCH73_16100 [Proteobacteria bacterium]|nr:hypothetical protein [Pseudomonadota bacterium]
MRWKLKLIRRRLFSRATQRMHVRGALFWPLRWLVGAVVLGLSGALALWAFEWGKDIAGLDRAAKQQVIRLQGELTEAQARLGRAQAVADTAESLLKAGEAAQTRLAEQLRQVEAENLALKADVGAFERLLPSAAGQDGVAVARFDVEAQAPGRLRYQALVVLGGRARQVFAGRYELTLSGTLHGQPWTMGPSGNASPLELTQYRRIEGVFEYPPDAVVKTAQFRVLDAKGAVRASEQARL